MKKLCSIILVLSLLFGLFTGLAGTVSAHDDYGEGYFTRDNGDGTCTIFYFESDAAEIIVPEAVEGMPVTALGPGCFEMFEQLESVVLPDSICSIGPNAFHGCKKLESITIPGAVSYIGWSAFEGCGENGIHIFLSQNVSYVGVFSLGDSSSITVSSENPYFSSVDGVLFSKDQTKLLQYPTKSPAKSYVIPSTVIELAEYSFSGAEALESVTIPDSVKYIGGAAFMDSGLTAVTIPESVKTINYLAFCGCRNLKTVTFPEELYVLDYNAFSGCESLEEIVLPYGISEVSNELFNGCSSLKRVVIPSSVGDVRQNAFNSCEALSDVEFTGTQAQWDSMGGKTNYVQDYRMQNFPVRCTGTAYEDSLFCYALDSRSGKATVYGLKNSAKEYESLIVPQEADGKPVSVIAPYTFKKCGKLCKIVLPEGLAVLGTGAFDSSRALQNVSLPSTLRYIGDMAFYECNSLRGISIPEGITIINSAMFHNCYKLERVSLPDSVTGIDSYAFCGCRALSSLELPDNLQSISTLAFDGCSSLQYIIFPDSIQSIGEYAFDGCTSLRWVYIPDSLKAADGEVFYGCSNLAVYYEGSEEQWKAISGNDNILTSADATLYYNYKPAVGSFFDVKESDWFYRSAAYVYEHELMNGTSEYFFSPSGSLTRGQLVTILYRIAGKPAVSGANTFKDVNDGRYYSDAVKWAAKEGIVTGYSDGTFRPDNKISREQIATILYRYTGSPGVGGTLDFPDAASVSSYAGEAMRWAAQQGLITGISSGGVTTLSPKSSATRAQIATIIMRYLEAE